MPKVVTMAVDRRRARGRRRAVWIAPQKPGKVKRSIKRAITMRTMFSLPVMAMAFAAAAPAFAAAPPGYITSVTVGTPDPNGKVPNFNAVPGSGVGNWSIADPLAILTHGSPYEYCVTLQDANFTGDAEVSYRITQGTVVVQSGVINKKFSAAPGVWAWCIGSSPLPNLPGSATLEGIVSFKTTPKATDATLKIPILIQ
jgi:hypothetical protein